MKATSIVAASSITLKFFVTATSDSSKDVDVLHAFEVIFLELEISVGRLGDLFEYILTGRSPILSSDFLL